MGDRPTMRGLTIAQLYEAGRSQYEIAASVGVSQTTVSRDLKRLGVVVHRRQGDPRGSRHHAWRGDEVGYASFHRRVADARGRPTVCEECGSSTRRIDWANLTGRYADPYDYRALCRPCHMRFDGVHERRRRPLRPEDSADPRHGTIYGYRDRGCRCPACRAANAAQARIDRDRRKAKAALPR